MKIVYEIALFFMMVNLSSWFVVGLGVFPSGVVPLNGEPVESTDAPESIVNIFLGGEAINISILTFSATLQVNWGSLITLITGTMLGVAYIIGNTATVGIALVAVSILHVLMIGKTWFLGVAMRAGPSVVFMFLILFAGALWIFAISLFDAHAHGGQGMEKE